MDMKLEVVVVPVSDVDRAKDFYKRLKFREDIDFAGNDGYRVVQLTPPGSGCSIIFGKGVTSAQPGSIDRLVLAVDDIDAAGVELRSHGVEVSVFHDAGGPFNNAVENPRVSGRDPQGRSYYSFASFEDPDGNGWLLQEIQTRLPGREWNLTRPQAMDVATLAGLLRETAEHHGHFEKTHAEHHWWDWYAPYLQRASERQQSRGGSSCRRSLHGGGPSRSSPMMPFEWRTIWIDGGLLAHPQRDAQFRIVLTMKVGPLYVHQKCCSRLRITTS